MYNLDFGCWFLTCPFDKGFHLGPKAQSTGVTAVYGGCVRMTWCPFIKTYDYYYTRFKKQNTKDKTHANSNC